jgi:hypothetical protein
MWNQPLEGMMIAVNIGASLRGELDDRDGSNVQACAEKWWAISDATLDAYADDLMAVADNTIAGMFTIKGWSRPDGPGGKVVFELIPAMEWQWLVGTQSPVTWSRSQANPVRKVSRLIIDGLARNRPHNIDAGQGWSLDVAADGLSATVRSPGPAVAVTAIEHGTVKVILLEPAAV